MFERVFFSRRVTSAVPFCFAAPSLMPQDEPRGVGPEVQEAIKQAFSSFSANLTTVRYGFFLSACYQRCSILFHCSCSFVKRLHLGAL